MQHTAIENTETSIEHGAVGFISSLIPWLAPAPSAYFVWRSTIEHLAMHPLFAFVAAAVIEGLGIATVHLAMTMHEWNATKRKSDPEAPTWLAVLCGVAYLIATFGLTIVLEAVPALSMWAPAIFPVMAVVGAFNLTLHKQQTLRESDVIAEQAERLAKRQVKRQSSTPSPSTMSTQQASTPSTQSDDRRPASDETDTSADEKVFNTSDDSVDIDTIDASPEQAERARQARADSVEARRRQLVDIFADDPNVSIAAVARQFDVSRGTIYNDLDALESAGRVHKNGDGVKVLDA